METLSSIVIAGAGQAGAVAAATLRELGYTGTLTLVGQEPHPPYERPPLSKAVLQDEAAAAMAAVHPADFYRSRDVQLMTATPVRALDPAARTLRLADGSCLRYDRCLLATGGQARELPGLPRGTPGVHYIRTLDDAAALRQALRPGARVVVVGGGFLGLEVASTARALDAHATVLEAAPRLLERALPGPLADWLAARARQAGAALHLGCRLRRIVPGLPARVELEDGTVLRADVLVVAIGLAPSVELARDAGLAIDAATGGIQIDAACRSSDPHVYAAGDCTSQHRAALGASLRLESWQNANEQARIAAAALLDLPPPEPAYPWFWTDQYGCNVQMLGMPQPGLAYTCRGLADPAADAPRFIWLGLRDGVPVHGIAVNAGGDLRQLRVLFERGLPIDPLRFADAAQPLKPLVKACQAAAVGA
ncbi:NAD(P)/FAD-dependent oxidoreductase [Bordetella sp. BOR01]|uniref:NAD(P)/FAD-dependent oxidoreductase n=1 Tax=Bordetella sp. BOR01 TaxID=2854779 RepID=UPI001C44D71A|nr:FAD-dependent oxidoreductase [Bordetella sp. BOR01]MBV7485587.1 FAD-dependent oxidoreductase [Bordetella sp. BOR01]